MSQRTPLLLASNRLDAPEDPSPRTDFVELARALRADVSYPPPGGGAVVARVERATASDLRQALAAFRARKTVSVFVSLSEKVGVPLALLLGRRPNRAPHVLVGHNVTSEKKRALHARTGYLHRFAHIVTVATEQQRYVVDEAGVPAARVSFAWDKVDACFWRPEAGDAPRRSAVPPYLLCVGRERRDYITLREAVRGLSDLPVVIVASSPWSTSGTGQTGSDSEIPANITVRKGLSFAALRELYDNAALIAVPLEKGTRYGAGLNGVLEAQAMGKAPLVSRTPGIGDYVDDGVTGRWVAAGDADALRAAIVHALADEAGNARRGKAARGAVSDPPRNFDAYIGALAGAARDAETSGAQP